MIGLLDAIQAGYNQFIGEGQYPALFMAALLVLWLLDDKGGKEFRRFCILMLPVLLFPLTAKLLMWYQTNFYPYEALWQLLPMTPLLAYGAVEATDRMTYALTHEYGRWKGAVSRRKEHLYHVAVICVFTGLLLLCGTVNPARHITSMTRPGHTIPDAPFAVLKSLSTEKAVTVLADDEVAAWARIYNGNLCLPYGRDMWEDGLEYTYDKYGEEQTLLHNWVNAPQPGVIAELSDKNTTQDDIKWVHTCADNGYEYLIFSDLRMSVGTMASAMEGQKMYTPEGQIAGYWIYRLAEDRE